MRERTVMRGMARLFWRDFCGLAAKSCLWESGHFYFAPTAGHRAFAVAPRNVLDYDPMHGTLHSPWRVAKVCGDSPQRHEEPAPLRQAVIARRRLLTTRTAPAYAGMRRKSTRLNSSH